MDEGRRIFEFVAFLQVIFVYVWLLAWPLWVLFDLSERHKAYSYIAIAVIFVLIITLPLSPILHEWIVRNAYAAYQYFFAIGRK